MRVNTLVSALVLLTISSEGFAQSSQVLDYLYSISGRQTIAGQHNREPNAKPAMWTEYIKKTTGKYPALWSGDFLFQQDNIDERWTMIHEAKRQWDNGAVINLMWHACPPDEGEPCRWNPGLLNAQLDDDQWKELLTDGTPLNKRWKKRMEDIAVYLQYLEDNGVEVLFRPLHEMNQGKFWWGGRPGPDGTAKLFRLTHDYFTDARGLSNLIWVWDMQDMSRDFEKYNPGDEYWDVFAFDIYGKGYDLSWYKYVLSVVGEKPLAIGECSRLPSPEMLASQPRWVFVMPWAELVKKANSTEEIQRVYDDPRVITRDEMPGWKNVSVPVVATPSVKAQPSRHQPTPNDAWKSTEVADDGRVTFRVYAPKAEDVLVLGDFGQGGPMTKDDQGVWSSTVGPLKPDYYGYVFVIDGVRTVDPKNPLVQPGIARVGSVLLVPGKEAEFEMTRDVPHGEVRAVWYKSGTLGVQRRMHVYTPPGYEVGSESYPVFYLLHGGGDEDSGWSTIGRAGFILDNLIAAKKAVPMIVVMPNGSLPRPMGMSAGRLPRRDVAALEALYNRFTDELLKEIAPVVESTYRVKTGRKNRGLAGLSMGGGQTLRVFTSHPDKFAYVAIWSGGPFEGYADEWEKGNENFLTGLDTANNSVKHLEIVVGDEDHALRGCRFLADVLKQRGIKHELRITGGGHTWINWRRYLHAFAQRLFRPDESPNSGLQNAGR